MLSASGVRRVPGRADIPAWIRASWRRQEQYTSRLPVDKSKREEKQMEITKQTTMGDMLAYDRGIAAVLMQSGMFCVGCPSSIGGCLPGARHQCRRSAGPDSGVSGEQVIKTKARRLVLCERFDGPFPLEQRAAPHPSRAVSLRRALQCARFFGFCLFFRLLECRISRWAGLSISHVTAVAASSATAKASSVYFHCHASSPS